MLGSARWSVAFAVSMLCLFSMARMAHAEEEAQVEVRVWGDNPRGTVTLEWQGAHLIGERGRHEDAVREFRVGRSEDIAHFEHIRVHDLSDLHVRTDRGAHYEITVRMIDRSRERPAFRLKWDGDRSRSFKNNRVVFAERVEEPDRRGQQTIHIDLRRRAEDSHWRER